MLNFIKKFFFQFQVFCGLILLFLLVTVSQAQEYTAILHWHNKIELSFRVSGIVNNISVRVGDSVKKNAVLIKLDEREFINNQKATKAMTNLRSSELQEAKREMQRSTELYDQTVLSEHEFQLKKNKLTEAESLYQLARAEYLTANRDLEYSILQSPIDALILDISAYRKKTIISRFSTQTVITIADNSHMRARTRINFEKIRRLKNGDNINVVFNGETIKGVLVFPSLLENKTKYNKDQTIKYPIDIVFPVNASEFRAGLSAVVILP